MDCALFVVDSARNAVLRLKGWSPDELMTVAETLAGGNQDRPEGQIWGEGTAAQVKLWGPTFCAFASHSFVFSNSAEGPFGKILQLTDVTPLVNSVMPSLRLLADACCMTTTVADHAKNWADVAAYLDQVRVFLDGVEDANHESWQVPRGAEGPGGNFSNSLRLNVRSNTIALHRSLDHLAALGVPTELIARLSPRALATTPNENFNGRQRCQPLSTGSCSALSRSWRRASLFKGLPSPTGLERNVLDSITSRQIWSQPPPFSVQRSPLSMARC